MRTVERIPTRGLAAFLVAAAVVLAPLAVGTAHADGDRAEAREHFSRGKQLFEEKRYKEAIGEFATADRLAPSPILEFNIALCYDRLGDREEALRRYRIYLDRMPDAPNRDAVEAKIQRLKEGMRAEEAARAEAEEQKEPEEDEAAAGGLAGGGAESAGAESGGAESGRAESGVPESGGAGSGAAGSGAAGASAAEPAAGEPSEEKTTYQPTGDPELDRVAAVDVGSIRDQRVGEGGEGGASGAEGASGASSAAGAQSAGGSQAAGAGAPPTPNEPVDEPKKKDGDDSDPIYKQWWFWVVLAVGGLIAYDVLASDSNDDAQRMLMPSPGGEPVRGSGGAVLLRF